MVGLVGKSAKGTGPDIEEMVGVVGAEGDSPSELGSGFDQDDPDRYRCIAEEVDRGQYPGRPPTDHSD
jgi:hypothetical protein